MLISTTFAVEPVILSYFDNVDFVSRQQRHCSHPIHLLQRTMSSTPTTTPTPTTSPYKAGVGRTTRSLSISTLPSPTTSGRPLRSLSSTLSSPSRFIPQGSTQYNQAIAKSMTIDEMRLLHQKALGDAEAKRTELRLVLASRYRELVGSSDEVTKMRERSTELHQLVHALPSLMAKLAQSKSPQESKTDDEESAGDYSSALLRRELSRLPRLVHRALDKNQVHKAATYLIQLFQIIATHTNEYPLATAISDTKMNVPVTPLDPIIATQMKMTYLHVETIPARTIRSAKHMLSKPASHDGADAAMGAQWSASALSTLDLLKVNKPVDRAVPLLDVYFESKAKLLQNLLGQLTTPSGDAKIETVTAEHVLSEIISILQHDIILHPYQIFVRRAFPGEDSGIMTSMPAFDADIVKTKASHCLAAHLPLIRTKVKSVLVSIAGTTASALGQIRQSLYDKTDGADCMERLDSTGVCTWEEAVNAMVDVRIVLSQGGSNSSSERQEVPRKFSLWSALFSNTFSSLVHSLLTTSFHSVHVKVVSTLRTSLANAPPFSAMLPHEAFRNTLKIATELDAALLKVSDDAHELLVHAEERTESERRLRQSLYVQTCEIMGRLVCELRRMLLHKSVSDDATKEFLVGRLCHLLKFRLTALPTLLDPEHSPAVLQGTTGGMISLLELQSAFDLADDNDDGLITFEEAMEAVDSAFSGTQFHGAEMIRETLLLSCKPEESAPTIPGGHPTPPSNVTLQELALLSARGLRHEKFGTESALGTIQNSLNDIIEKCFSEWAQETLSNASLNFRGSFRNFLDAVSSNSESEWQRIYTGAIESNPPDFVEFMVDDKPSSIPTISATIGNVSPHIVGYLLAVASALNRSVCPSDAILLNPPQHYAATSGIANGNHSTMIDTIRVALLRQGLKSLAVCFDEDITTALTESELDDGSKKRLLSQGSASGIIQLNLDIGFVQMCLFKRNIFGFTWRHEDDRTDTTLDNRNLLEKASTTTERLLSRAYYGDIPLLLQTMDERHRHVLEVSDLMLSSLFGDDKASATTTSAFSDSDVNMGAFGSGNAILYNPLASSRRFGLLPIQSDRSLAELQRRKFGKGKDESEQNKGIGGGGVMSSFFSSMLKKK